MKGVSQQANRALLVLLYYHADAFADGMFPTANCVSLSTRTTIFLIPFLHHPSAAAPPRRCCLVTVAMFKLRSSSSSISEGDNRVIVPRNISSLFGKLGPPNDNDDDEGSEL